MERGKKKKAPPPFPETLSDRLRPGGVVVVVGGRSGSVGLMKGHKQSEGEQSITERLISDPPPPCTSPVDKDRF